MLYIDDSENDRLLIKEAISVTRTPFAFHEADSMDSAIPYLQSLSHVSESKQRPRPELVLLDYHMGLHTGADFLYWLRTIKEITSIPVVMFSGSLGKTHVEECYAAGTNHFISKPNDLERLKIIVRTLYLSATSHRPDALLTLREYRPDPKKR